MQQYGSSRGRKKLWCSANSVYWLAIAALGSIAGGSLYCLQGAYKEVATLRASADATETQRRSLREQITVQKQRLAQVETKVEGTAKERDQLIVTQQEAAAKLAKAEKDTVALTDLTKRLGVAEGKLAAAEEEIKEITVKAGACQQQFAALNADCATLKQGLANLGLTSQTVEGGSDKQLPKRVGALDPRGGIEAAKVLQNHSQQPWKASAMDREASGGGQGASSRVQIQQPPLLHDGSRTHIGTDVDETGPGLEKALVQGAAGR